MYYDRQLHYGATSRTGINQGITLEWNKVITITKRTLRFSKNVYQTRNISAFGEGEVEIDIIPWWIVILFLISGVASYFFDRSNQGGLLLLLVGIIGLVWNCYKPKHYGLLVTLNSGDKKLFITSDKEGLQKVISVIYELIETEEEATYQMSINNSQIKGNFIQGYTGGNISFNSDLFNSDLDEYETEDEINERGGY